MLVLKAVSKRHDGEFKLPCSGPHNTTEPATWDIDVALVGKIQLCTPHYREITQWECGNERKCNHINYGMTSRCVCGWVRPDTCSKCGEWSTVPLIKITEERAPHACHSCNGDAKERGLTPCESCNGNVVVSEHECFTCYGTGRMFEGGKKCSACEGSGRSRTICQTCKGAGEVMGWLYSTCATCDGSGICRASSANWGVDRIPLTDILPEHREKLIPHVGQYLCFRCANPDFQFTPYRNNRTPLQCSHVTENPNELVRCTNDVARNNPSSKFCFAHSNKHQCGVCRKKLELDESGGRCRIHAKCGVCNEPPVDGSLFCASHHKYQPLGRMLEKQVSPESPPQILKAQEGVLKSRKDLDRRCSEALERSKELSGQIVKLEQTQHEIIANDPQVNQWRRDEIMKIETEIAGLDKTPEGEEKEAKLRKEVGQLEEEINNGRDDRESILLGRLSIKIDGLKQEMTKVLAEYARNQHIDKELQELSDRLHSLRHYELWERDKGRTPEYVGKPLIVTCKNCAVEFNVRTPTKWLCPHCTTVSYIETRPVKMEEIKIGEKPHMRPGKWSEWAKSVEVKQEKADKDAKLVKSVEGKQAEAIKAFKEKKKADKKRRWEVTVPPYIAAIPLPTNNLPEYEHVKELICEVCRKDVKELKPTQLLLRPRYRLSDNEVEVPSLKLPEGHRGPRGTIYLVCPSCAFWESGRGNVLREEQRKEIAEELIEKERLTILSASITHGIMEKYSKKKRLDKNEETMGKRPEPLPLPPMEDINKITKDREEAKKKELTGQTAVALEKFKVLIAKDESTIEEMIEMGRLRSFLHQTYKENDLPKKVVEKEVVVPPPPPSRWRR